MTSPRSLLSRLTAGLAAFALLNGCAGLPSLGPAPPPTERPVPRGPAMVAAANPLAVEAGLAVLRRGGSAVDAAIAVQAVLGLVEPQSSGIGGGAFLVHYEARYQRVTAYDGRETAPAGATPSLFLGADGKPLTFVEAVLSGRSTGVPGAVAMLEMAHRDHGKLAWSSLFGDARRLAQDGFKISPRLAGMINGPFPQTKTADAKAYFSRPDGTPMQAGDTLKNLRYAQTMDILAAEGAKGLLRGAVAAEIVQKTTSGAGPSSMTLADLANYRPRRGPALCQPYRVYVLCTAQPSSSGVALLQGMALLERTDIAERGPEDPVAWIQIAEAERLMYADRDRYVGDPAFVPVPVAGLLNGGYLDQRAQGIGERIGPAPSFGLPPGAGQRGPDATNEPGGTSHFVIVDGEGNAVSMTTTVESIFGSGRMAAGFFLNNQLTDFSFSPTDKDGTPAANAVAGGKRPRSSMSPVIVLDRQGRFVAALGSPGGTAILSYNLKTLVGVLDWKLTMQQAIDLPNLIARGDSFNGEAARFAPGVVDKLAARGLVLKSGAGENSGLHGIIVLGDGTLQGGADPRREGVARAP